MPAAGGNSATLTFLRAHFPMWPGDPDLRCSVFVDPGASRLYDAARKVAAMSNKRKPQRSDIRKKPSDRISLIGMLVIFGFALVAALIILRLAWPQIREYLSDGMNDLQRQRKDFWKWN